METNTLLLYIPIALLSAWFIRTFLHVRSVNRVIRNLPGPPSPSFWIGNIGQLFNRHGHEYQMDVALNYGPVVKLQGVLGRDMLYVSDPRALHTILIKEDRIFEEPKAFIAINNLIFGPSLIGTVGEHHRKQRKILNPVFSINHMRYMLPLFYRIISTMRNSIAAQVQSGQSDIDVHKWCGRAALELVGQGGLGYSFDPLLSAEVNDEYGDALKALFPSLVGTEAFLRLLPLVSNIGSPWFRRLVVDAFPSSAVQNIKNVVDTMSHKSAEIIRSKRTALLKGEEVTVKQIGEGKDIMSVLMQANMLASEEDRLPEEELVAQVATLILGAYDTTSNTLARILQLLAEHQDIQDKLRQEILDASAGDEVPYDTLNKLPLLDAVCRETLRWSHSSGYIAFRMSLTDSVLPLSAPIKGVDGQTINEIPISAGTEVIIGTLGSNLNKARWGADSLEWKPERWLSPLPSAVTEASIPGVYSHLMTFMGGKRACIGFKFSEMEMKIVLSVLLSAFTFESMNKEVTWNVAAVLYPTVGKDSDVPALPLKVGMYDPSTL